MEASIAMTHFTSSAIVVYVMQKAKTARWFPLLQHGWAAINRTVSVVAAFAISVGIDHTWDPSTRGLTIIVPTMWGILLALWHVLNQYAMQETIYQATSNKSGNGATPSGTASASNPPAAAAPPRNILAAPAMMYGAMHWRR